LFLAHKALHYAVWSRVYSAWLFANTRCRIKLFGALALEILRPRKGPSKNKCISHRPCMAWQRQVR